MKAMTSKNMIKKSLVILPPIVILIQRTKTNHLCLSIHHHCYESNFKVLLIGYIATHILGLWISFDDIAM